MSGWRGQSKHAQNEDAKHLSSTKRNMKGRTRAIYVSRIQSSQLFLCCVNPLACGCFSASIAFTLCTYPQTTPTVTT